MINRLNDFNCFDENDFLKLKMILNKEKTKILNEKEAKLYKDIKSNVNIQETVDGYQVIDNDKINFDEAMLSGLFKKVAWGEYAYNGRQDNFSSKYSFDDGSIWKVEKDENGNEFLIKEIDDNDNLVRIASNEKIIINNRNCENAINVLSIFQNKDEILNYIFNDKNIKKIVFEKINNDIKKYVQEYITKHKYIESKDLLEDIMNIIGRMLNSNEIKDLSNLDEVIKTICDKTMTIENKYSFFKEDK